jgi:1,4-alpha-glucan branching enzyme
MTLVEDQLARHRVAAGGVPLMAAVYDAELFGHWWAEGVPWLADVLRRLAAHDSIELTDAATYVQGHPPAASIAMERGSWGIDGNDSTWLNGKTAWMWPVIHRAERRAEAIVARYAPPGAGDGEPIALPHAARAGAANSRHARAAIDQMLRELLLLQSSDWPYLLTTGEAAAYAERRFSQHAERFDALAAMLESGHIAQAYVDDLAQRDNVFPDIDPRDYAPLGA